MEHCRNSTGLIFRRFAIFYDMFLAILLIFDVDFVRYPACPAFLAIISPTFARHMRHVSLSHYRTFFVNQQLCSVSLQVVQLYQAIK